MKDKLLIWAIFTFAWGFFFGAYQWEWNPLEWKDGVLALWVFVSACNLVLFINLKFKNDEEGH